MNRWSVKVCPKTGKQKYIRWIVDLNDIGSSGTPVYWTVVGYRDVDDPDYDTYDENKEPHNWGLFPAKYDYPPEDPTQFASGKYPDYNYFMLN